MVLNSLIESVHKKKKYNRSEFFSKKKRHVYVSQSRHATSNSEDKEILQVIMKFQYYHPFPLQISIPNLSDTSCNA